MVEDESLRDAMKTNGIGRPSTRANIIETLFKRAYIKRVKKQIHPTPLGVALIQLIDNKLLTSAELTGRWEKRLREIESGTYKASGFIEQMKKMVDALVVDVRLAANKRLVLPELEKKDKLICPKCKEGEILKGKTAYGCSAYSKGCDFRLPFVYMDKKMGIKSYESLINKKKSNLLKGFVLNNQKTQGHLMFNDHFELVFHEKAQHKSSDDQSNKIKLPVCPKCHKGQFLKGKSAWGCSEYKNGCTFIIPFSVVSSTDKLSNELIEKYFATTKDK